MADVELQTDHVALGIVETALESVSRCVDRLKSDEEVRQSIVSAGRMMAARLRAGGRILACGNGGSMCQAMHFAEELTGNFRLPRRPLAAIALSDAAHLSCTANDFDFTSVFARLVEAHGREGDVLLAISTSGSSPNVVRAAEAARRQRMRVITLTGKPTVELDALADVSVYAAGGRWADRIQELHLAITHIWLELIEHELIYGGEGEN